METDSAVDPDWIPVALAAKLVPSPHGKRTALSTIYRWIERGRLDSMERDQGSKAGPRKWWFVRRSQVLAMLRPKPRHVSAPLPDAAAMAEEDRWVQEGLRRHGLAK